MIIDHTKDKIEYAMHTRLYLYLNLILVSYYIVHFEIESAMECKLNDTLFEFYEARL